MKIYSFEIYKNHIEIYKWQRIIERKNIQKFNISLNRPPSRSQRFFSKFAIQNGFQTQTIEMKHQGTLALLMFGVVMVCQVNSVVCPNSFQIFYNILSFIYFIVDSRREMPTNIRWCQAGRRSIGRECRSSRRNRSW